MICNLNQEDGKTTEDGDEMRNIVTSYYKQVLTKDNMATGEDIREDIILQSIPEKVTMEMNTWLMRPLLIIEIWRPSPICMQIIASESTHSSVPERFF